MTTQLSDAPTFVALEGRVDALETIAVSGNAAPYATWALLNAVVLTSIAVGTRYEVVPSDTGTHSQTVGGVTSTENNSGIYAVVDDSGTKKLKRIYDYGAVTKSQVDGWTAERIAAPFQVVTFEHGDYSHAMVSQNNKILALIRRDTGQWVISLSDESVLPAIEGLGSIVFEDHDAEASGWLWPWRTPTNQWLGGVDKEGRLLAVFHPDTVFPTISPAAVDAELTRHALPHAGDIIPVTPDNWRGTLGGIPLRSSIDGTAFQPLPAVLTPSVRGLNATGTSLQFRRSARLPIKGRRYCGTFAPTLNSTTYKSLFTTAAPSTVGAVAGDYWAFVDTTSRTIGSDTFNIGDLYVWNGSALVREAGPVPSGGSAYTNREPGDWWIVTAAFTFDGISYAVGDRIVYVGFQSNSGTGWARWVKGAYATRGELFYRGEVTPAAGIGRTRTDGELFQSNGAGQFGNPFQQSEDFSSTVWSKTQTSITSNVSGNLDRLTRLSTAASAFTQINGTYQTFSYAIGTVVGVRQRVKLGSLGNLHGLRIQGTYPNMANAVFDLSAGTVAYSGGLTFTGVSATITPDGSEFIVTLVATVAGSPAVNFVFGPAASAGNSWEAASGGAGLIDSICGEIQHWSGTTQPGYIPTGALGIPQVSIADGDLILCEGGTASVLAQEAVKTVPANSLVNLPCNLSASEWEFRRTDKSNTRANGQLSARVQTVPAKPLDDLVLYSDSMFGVNTVGDRIIAAQGRPGTVFPFGGGTSEHVLSMIHYEIARLGDRYRADVLIAWHGQNNQPSAVGDDNWNKITSASLAMRNLQGSAFGRVLLFSILGTRGMTWNGSRLVNAQTENSFAGTGALYALEQWYEANFNGQWISPRLLLLAAAAGSTVPDLMYPGMTEAQVASTYGVPPTRYYAGWSSVPAAVQADPASANYIGTHSTAGLPTGGSSGDYKIRIANGTVGNLIFNVGGVWSEAYFDPTHLSSIGAQALADGASDTLDARFI